MSASPTTESPADVVARLRDTYRSGRTRPLAWRRQQLESLRHLLEMEESTLFEAMSADLRRSPRESWIAEIGPLLAEIREALENLPAWMRDRPASLPLPMQPGSARIRVEPRGVGLVISPWNYPVDLTLSPAVAGLAAGNCLVLKPSELSAACSEALRDIVPRYLDPDAVAVVAGGVDETTDLLAQRFDIIFYTGGPRVGRIVMEAAARHLTPVALELGGKNPTIVLDDANIRVAARRIAWGKFVNAGQTCLAPDYILATPGIVSDLIDEIASAVRDFYGPDPQQSSDFARIINRRHTERLAKLLEGQDAALGGDVDLEDCYVAPTILRGVSLDAPVMQDEIFGPILPVVTVPSLDAAVDVVNEHPDPLGLYLFSKSRDAQRRVLDSTRSGGAVINDVIIHFAVLDLPFGGIGESGMGAYHGVHGFEAFSHRRAVVAKWRGLDAPLRYPPYSDGQLSIIKRLL